MVCLKTQLHVSYWLNLGTIRVCEVDRDDGPRDDASVVLDSARIDRPDVDDSTDRKAAAWEGD